MDTTTTAAAAGRWNDRLTVDPRVDASDIEVVVKDGEVTLNGSVRGREEKRYAEEGAEHVMGVRDVNNHLKVSRDVNPSSPPQAAGKR